MFLVGIAGGSGSGKTTFAKKILQSLSPDISPQVGLLHQDSYYLASPRLKDSLNPNFDHPACFDWPLLREQLHRLQSGHTVAAPVYDFRVNHRAPDSQPVGPCAAVLFEGIFTLWDETIRKSMNLKIFLNVEADVRFIRRLKRDIQERGRSLEEVVGQYYSTVRPMHHEHLEPTRQFADLIVGNETDIAAEVVAARLQEAILRKMKEDS